MNIANKWWNLIALTLVHIWINNSDGRLGKK
jgi:hypothetical protein